MDDWGEGKDKVLRYTRQPKSHAMIMPRYRTAVSISVHGLPIIYYYFCCRMSIDIDTIIIILTRRQLLRLCLRKQLASSPFFQYTHYMPDR